MQTLLSTIVRICVNCDSRFVSPFDELKEMAGTDERLQYLLVDILVHRFCREFMEKPSSICEEQFSELYKYVCEHSAVFVGYGKQLTPNQEKQVTNHLKVLINNVNTIGKYDVTKAKGISRQGEKSIYKSVLTDLHVFDGSISTTTPKVDVETLIREKRIALYQQCIRNIQKFDSKRLFSSPVTPDIAPDYSKYVRNPMDLNTMFRKASKYQNINEMKSDLTKIVDNSVIYNGKDALITKMAIELVQQGEQEIAKCGTAEKELLIGGTPDCDVLNILFVELGVALHTPFLYSQLLRAIWQRLLHLIFNENAPVNNGKLDSVLYQYYNLITLIQYTDTIISTTQNADTPSTSIIQDHGWQPRWLLSDEVKLLPATYGETLNLLTQLVVQHVQNLPDTDTLLALFKECSTNPSNCHLVLCAASSQMQRMIVSRNTEDFEVEHLILQGILGAVAGLPSSVLLDEWAWIESICLTLLCAEVRTIDLSEW